MSPAVLRQHRALWLQAARDCRYRAHRDLGPHFIHQARAVHRQLLQLIRAAAASSFRPLEVQP
jgi:hypothetical protein